MKPNVLIGTPAYNSQVHTDFVHSLIGIESAKNANLLNYSLCTIGNESLITRARNSIISVFYNNPQFTHLLFIDADLGFPKEALPLLLQQEKDVIGIPVPLKGIDENGNKVYNVGKKLTYPDENGVFITEHIGNAFLMISRKASKDLCETANKYKPSGLTRGDRQHNTQFDVFQVGVKNGIYLSEDYFVCHKLRFLGYDIFVYPNINITHNGIFSF